MFPEWLRSRRNIGTGAGLATLSRTKLTGETWTWLLVALGVILRLGEYGDNRLLYKDEECLLQNLVEYKIHDFTTTLTESQLAPPGFLVVERIMVRLPLPVVPAGRLVPLLCSIASMFLMRSVARRYVSPRAVPIAVGLFALNDWMLYYSAELKQYSGDVALTLVALLLAAGPTAMTPSRLRLLICFGVVGVWFSHPLALVLAGVGTYFIAQAVLRRDWNRALGFVAMSLAWALSFAICYKVSHGILSKDRFIWNWWDFAFLPLPPRSLADLERTGWQVLNLLNAPGDVLMPVGVLWSAFIALGLFMLGGLALARRWRGGLYLLLAPLLFALLASALHQYPFHGRLLLFLVPSVHLLVSEGAVALAWCGGARLTFALAAFLLFQPAFDVLRHRLIVPRDHSEFDSHGDITRDLLDYLETLEYQRSLRRARHEPLSGSDR